MTVEDKSAGSGYNHTVPADAQNSGKTSLVNNTGPIRGKNKEVFLTCGKYLIIHRGEQVNKFPVIGSEVVQLPSFCRFFLLCQAR